MRMLPVRAAAGVRATARRHGPAGTPITRFLTHPDRIVHHLAHLLLAALTHWGAAAGLTAASAAAAVIAGRAWLHARQHAVFARGARTITVLAPPQADPAGAETLWANLAGLMRPPLARWWHGQPHLGWEYTWTPDQMAISAWIPGTIPPGMIERAVEAAWPGAHTITAPASPPLPAGCLATGGRLRLARPEVLPLKTDHGSDPLRALAAAGTGLAGTEQAIVQVLARPVTGSRLRRARRAIRRLRYGQPGRLPSRLLDAITPGGHSSTRRAGSRSDPDLSDGLRAALTKAVGPQWETQIRYAVTTTTAAGGGRARRIVTARARRRLRGQAHALASAFSLYAGRNWLARRHLRRPAARIADRRFRGGDLLSVAELACLARLPADASVPGLARAGARAVPPPPAIPGPGAGARPLGAADAGPPRPVAITVPDARHHMRIIGATGAGKTTLILAQILADAGAGRGAVFIDPKGDAVTDLLPRLPERLAGKVVLFDPASRGAPPCLNVLQGNRDGSDTDVICDNITGIFRRIYAAFWGPRTDDIFRAAVLTLLRSVPAGSGLVNLADIPSLLGSDAYRRRKTSAITDPVLKGFWEWYEQLSGASRAHAVGPLMNKLRAFLLRPFVAQAIAAGPSTFTMSQVLDEGGLLLARLPKGVLGEETCRLLGSFIVAATWQTAARRARLPQHARPDAGLYIDECQNFLNLPYPLEDMLAKARAYRLSVVMAHQNLAQLPADLREGISANARSQVIFNASPEDARVLERHTLPHLTAHDLSHLGAYQAAAKLIAGGADTPAFTLRTQPLPPGAPGRAALIRRAARPADRVPEPPPQPGPAPGDPRRSPATA